MDGWMDGCLDDIQFELVALVGFPIGGSWRREGGSAGRGATVKCLCASTTMVCRCSTAWCVSMFASARCCFTLFGSENVPFTNRFTFQLKHQHSRVLFVDFNCFGGPCGGQRENWQMAMANKSRLKQQQRA